MASSMLSYMPNSASLITADPIPRQCSLKQDHLSFLTKPNDRPLTTTTTSTTSTNYKQSIISNSPITASSKPIAAFWREIQGSNNWENLVEPLHPYLRNEIVRYGEFVTACYKAFDLDPSSKRYLNCKYGKKSMLKEVGMAESGYKVTKYIYATAPDVEIPMIPTDCCGRWIGYVAVSEDKEVIRRLGRRDIVITFRGTITNLEWAANLMSSLTPARLDPHDAHPEVKVEAGFLSLYTSNESATKFGLCSCREQLLSEVSRLLKKYKGEEISITLAGHSMGSSLALLLAYDIAELGLNKIKNNEGQEELVPVSVFSFGGPRVGNLGFKERCEELGVKALRIVNVNDPITKLPGVLFNENNFFRAFKGRPFELPCYAHVGVELLVDFFKIRNPSCVHDLESYIGLLKSSCHKSHLNNSNVRKGSMDQRVGLMERAQGFLLGGAQNVDLLHWGNIAFSMVNLVQISQWI